MAWTDEELDAAFNSYQQAPLGATTGSSFSDEELDRYYDHFMQAITPPTDNRSTGRKIYDASGAILNGLAFGFGDEIVGKSRQALELLGGADAATAQKAWEDELAFQRAANKEFAANNPKEALAYELAGGLASSLLPVGAGAKALQGLSWAQKAGKAAKTGAALGGLYGLGSADPEPGATIPEILSTRAKGAGIGAGAGAVLGGGLQAGISGVGAAGGKLASALSGLLPAGEAGAVGGSAAIDPVLRRIASKMTAEEAQIAEMKLAEAIRDGVPLMLAESAESPLLRQYSRLIANKPETMNQAQAIIQQRIEQSGQRVSNILDDVFPEDSALAGAKRFTEGAEQIVGDAKAIREKATKGVYKEAFDKQPLIEGDEIADLLQEPSLQQSIERVRAALPRQLANEPDNSLKVLHYARRDLNDLRSTALAKGTPSYSTTIAENIKSVINKLDDVLQKESPVYIEAKNKFAEASRLVNRLEGNQWGKERTFGLLEDLTGGDPEKAAAATRQLMKMQPETIRKIRGLFGTKYREEWRAGIRSYLQEVLDNTGERRDLVGALQKNPRAKDKLRAALGRDDYERLQARLEREQLMHEYGRGYHEGSSTSANLAQNSEEARQGAKGTLRTLYDAIKSAPTTAVDALDRIFAPNLDKRTADKLVQALFTPEGGLDVARQLQPILADKAELYRVAQGLAQAGATATRGPAAQQAGRLAETLANREGQGAKGANTAISIPLPRARTQKGTTGTGGETMAVKKPMQTSALAGEKAPEKVLLAAIKKVESGDLGPAATSPKGAKGSYQFIDATGKEYHKRLGIKEAYDPRNEAQQEKLAAAFMKDLNKKYDDPRLAIAAYNYGETKLDKLLRQHGNSYEAIEAYLPTETAAYVPKVLKNMVA